MDELLHSLILACMYVLWIMLIPLIVLIATPFVLFWPVKRMTDGTKANKNIIGRYQKIWDVWKSIGLGLPTS